MKQCPNCQRTYSDETLTFCLADGSLLSAPYDPEATQRFYTAPTDNAPPTETLPGHSPHTQPVRRGGNLAPMYLVGGFLALMVVVVGTVIWLRTGTRYDESSKSSTPSLVSSSTTSKPTDLKPGNQAVSSTPSIDENKPVGPPPSAQLVGNWRADVSELGEQYEINWELKADGSSDYFFKFKDGRTHYATSSWRYSNETIYETYSDGASGRASIDWIDRDTFVLTIIDNGMPAYTGLKRRYYRQ